MQSCIIESEPIENHAQQNMLAPYAANFQPTYNYESIYRISKAHICTILCVPYVISSFFYCCCCRCCLSLFVCVITLRSALKFCSKSILPTNHIFLDRCLVIVVRSLRLRRSLHIFCSIIYVWWTLAALIWYKIDIDSIHKLKLIHFPINLQCDRICRFLFSFFRAICILGQNSLLSNLCAFFVRYEFSNSFHCWPDKTIEQNKTTFSILNETKPKSWNLCFCLFNINDGFLFIKFEL